MSGTLHALHLAAGAQVALEQLAAELDRLATALDRAPERCVDAGRCARKAEEARGAARLLVEWQGHLRRLRVPGVDAE
ncbi:MAG: hypothetical protein EOM21_19000 [Gammaproteobacteria bacterium]|nr:hypothetical protein [Gammaproteobacteria bacterium]